MPVATQIDADDFRARWAAGEDVRSMGGRFGVSKATVSRIAVNLGLPQRRPRRVGGAGSGPSDGQGRLGRVSEAELREVWGDRRISVEEIAERFGVSRATIRNRARQYALPYRPTGRPSQAELDAYDLPLVGGRWVPGPGGVQRWQADG